MIKCINSSTFISAHSLIFRLAGRSVVGFCTVLNTYEKNGLENSFKCCFCFGDIRYAIAFSTLQQKAK